MLLLLSLGSTSIAQEPITLRMTGLTGASGIGTEAAIEVWNANNPDIQVELEIQADEMGWQATAPSTMFLADDGPDLSWWWCSPTTQYKDMIAAGLLAPLDDLYESEGWLDAYPKGTLDYFLEPDGHRYGINTDVVWTPYVYYNKDIFAELGVEPPQTWDELYEIGEKATAAGYLPLSMVYEMSMRSHLPDALMLRSWTEEEYNAFLVNSWPNAPEASLEHKWTDPNGVRIFQTMKDMADKGLYGDGFAGLTDYNEAKSLFTTGNAAMYQSGSWEGGTSGIPAAVDFEWGYFYYPFFEDSENYGPVGSWVPNCFIAFNRPNLEAAKKVIAFLASPEGATLYGAASGLPPGRIDLSEDAVATIVNGSVNQMLADVASMGAPALYESAVPPQLLSTLKQASDLMLTGSATPEEAAAMMQEETEKAREG
jgi:ABC-type glycerol-3-phosphate transport system substrate-binding protein